MSCHECSRILPDPACATCRQNELAKACGWHKPSKHWYCGRCCFEYGEGWWDTQRIEKFLQMLCHRCSRHAEEYVDQIQPSP